MLVFQLANAGPIKVAVIDSGFDFNSEWKNAETEEGLTKPKLCSEGHKDFTGEGFKEKFVHGTPITGIIAREAYGYDYCIVVIKYYIEGSEQNQARLIRSILWAVDQEVDVINYSGGGLSPDSEEEVAIKFAVNLGIHIVTVAGNGNPQALELKREFEGKRSWECLYYPACYNALIEVIGAVDSKGKVLPTSNYGTAVTAFRNGLNVYSLLPGNSYGFMSGTSMAAATRTGEYVKELDKIKKLYIPQEPKILKRHKILLAPYSQ